VGFKNSGGISSSLISSRKPAVQNGLFGLGHTITPLVFIFGVAKKALSTYGRNTGGKSELFLEMN